MPLTSSAGLSFVLASAALIALASCGSGDGAPPQPQPGNAQPPVCFDAATNESLSVDNVYGSIQATLVLPPGCGRRPVALILPGSGPTDRDGNGSGVSARSYLLLSDGLARAGIGSLRYDKAGVGASRAAAPAETDMRFEMGSGDAALLVEALRADARVGKLTFIGHSEGSLVGMLAAHLAPVDAFVSLAGPGRPMAGVLREQLAQSIADESLRVEAIAIVDALEQGEYVESVPEELAIAFRPSVQGYLISMLKYDPADEMRDLPVASILIAQGSTDTQVGLADAERLGRARPDARLAIFDGMNHELKSADFSSASQLQAYGDPDLPVVADLVEELARFAAP